MKSAGLHSAFLIVTLFLAPQLCGAYETDQFSNRLEPIKDSTEPLDRRVNQSIEDLVENWKGPRSQR